MWRAADGSWISEWCDCSSQSQLLRFVDERIRGSVNVVEVLGYFMCNALFICHCHSLQSLMKLPGGKEPR